MKEKDGHYLALRHQFPANLKIQCKAVIKKNVNFLRALGVKSEHRTECANNVKLNQCVFTGNENVFLPGMT